MIIFPELSLTGYVARDQIYELAEPVPGPSTRFSQESHRKRKHT
jgi:predicted amidohydrolase